MIEHLEELCDVFTDTEVTDVNAQAHLLKVVHEKEETEVYADSIIFAVGRSGSGFISNWCIKNGIHMKNNQVDIGVRVEMPWLIWEHFSKKIYEPKIW